MKTTKLTEADLHKFCEGCFCQVQANHEYLDPSTNKVKHSYDTREDRSFLLVKKSKEKVMETTGQKGKLKRTREKGFSIVRFLVN